MKQLAQLIIPPSAWEYARSKYKRTRHAIVFGRYEIVSFSRNGIAINLAISDPVDLIQSEQRKGKFYEEDELEAISPYFPRRGTFVDVGANTGQHSVYFAKLFDAKCVLVEPVARTCSLLEVNLRINNIEDRCTILPGIGFSDHAGYAKIELPQKNNIGSACLSEISGGSIALLKGDDALAGRKIDMIKIDTEGLEMKVLSGLRDTIARDRPLIYIEIDNVNRDAFSAFLKTFNYEIRYRNRRYPENENFLIAPV